MSAETNRRISDDESAGVFCCFIHNMTVDGKLANKKARRDHMADCDLSLGSHLFLVFLPRQTTPFLFLYLVTIMLNCFLSYKCLVVGHHRFLSLI